MDTEILIACLVNRCNKKIKHAKSLKEVIDAYTEMTDAVDKIIKPKTRSKYVNPLAGLIYEDHRL